MKAEDALNMAKSYVRKTAEGLGAVKGKDGKDGISPTIVENTNNTDGVYKLDITDVNGTFTTPNLKGYGGTDGTSVIDDTTSSLNTTYSSSKIESTFAKSDDVTAALEGKVDTVVGKGLSTNDYTTEEKTKLASLENYDDTTLSQRVTDIENDYAKTADIPTVPTKTSELTNDSGYITNIVDDLLNYYKKSDTYSKEEIAGLIGNINKLTSEIVESLPTENISTSTIYLIKDVDTNNYKQYMYISGAWAQLSDTNIDLSGYAKLTDLDTKVDKVEGKTLSTNDFTNVLKSKLDGIAEGAQVNVIESIKVNGTALEVTEKGVNILVPTGTLAGLDEVGLAQLNAELKALINGKANAADVYTKTETDAAITSAVNAAVAGIYKVKGSVAFATLPTEGMSEGDVYNVSDAFTTTESFVEGAGKQYPAGTNVVVVNTAEEGSESVYKWDCMAGVYDFSDFVKKGDIAALTSDEISALCPIYGTQQ